MTRLQMATQNYARAPQLVRPDGRGMGNRGEWIHLQEALLLPTKLLAVRRIKGCVVG